MMTMEDKEVSHDLLSHFRSLIVFMTSMSSGILGGREVWGETREGAFENLKIGWKKLSMGTKVTGLIDSTFGGTLIQHLLGLKAIIECSCIEEINGWVLRKSSIQIFLNLTLVKM